MHRSARSRVVICCVAAAMGSIGCRERGGPTPPSPAGFGDRCDESSITQQPDLMGTSLDFRANVSATRQQGVLSVRYAAKGCEVELEVLPNCVGTGSYAFAPYPGNESKVASDSLELFAKLPLGAATLQGKLANGRSLRTDYMFAGMLTLPIGQPFERSALRGQDCSRATHVVNRIYVGGFALASGQTREIQAAATVFGIGAGAGSNSSLEVLASEGLREQCAAAQQTGELSPQCQAPLRLGLLALSDTDPNAYAADADGFVPLLVVDTHGCRANEEVWNGSRCESLSAPTPKPTDAYFRDEHGCVMGKQVWLQGVCKDAEGTDLYESLSLEK